MMRPAATAMAFTLTMAASNIEAQTTAGDGIDAFVRRDYQRAAEILKPLAEAWPPGNHAAELFMATMHENGLGVPADAIRACALYNRAANRSPLETLIVHLLQSVMTSLRDEELQQCNQLADIGFGHSFQSATFTLEPDYWVALDFERLTISYKGVEKGGTFPVAVPGAVFLPVKHTALASGLPPRRHFIEYFMWVPQGASWMLLWRVFEIVRDEAIPITNQTVMTIAAGPPQTDQTLDVRAQARLRIGDNGHAEWVVFDGANTRSEPIESVEERREVAEQKRAREAALARADWKLIRDRFRQPTLSYSDADGCGDLFVYGWSEDRTELIALQADRELLQLSTTPRTLDPTSQQLELTVYVHERPVRDWPFCTDVGAIGPTASEAWTAIAGSITIELSPPGIRAREPHLYRVTIRISGAEFLSASGIRIKQGQPITLTAIVDSRP